MENFLLGKSNFFNCLKKSKFSEICLQNSIFFVKLPERIEIFRKFALEIEIFRSGSTIPEISNQIGAAVAILLLISLWHHRRSCFLSSRMFYNFPYNYYLHYLILILYLLSRLLSF